MVLITKFDETNNIFDGGYSTSGTGAPPILVTADGVILNQGGPDPLTALDLNDGLYNVTINGLVGAFNPDDTGVRFGFFESAGSDKLTVGSTGIICGGVVAAHATNISNNGVILGSANWGIFEAESGTYTIANFGEIFGQILISGTGIHTIKNSGAIVGVSLAINALGGDVEKVTNSGRIDGDIALGGGNDTFTNSGLIVADSSGVDMGGGNDTFTNFITDALGVTKSGIIQGTIQLLDGNDTFNGGSEKETVQDYLGKDTYKLGGGDDVFIAVATSSDTQLDTIAGGGNKTSVSSTGSGGDRYDASQATNNLYINLELTSKADVFLGALLVAKSATGFDVGTDSLTGFETVYCGTGNDIVFGDASANYLDGWSGKDALHGGAGNDYINAGFGADRLTGGAGRDTLFGGGPLDGDTDKFIYNALSDSTVAPAGRDRILAFEDGFDIIDLSLVNLHLPTFVGVDQAFTPIAGNAEVRALTTSSGWLIQLDKNGDAKVDMAIEVVNGNHSITWSGADFSLSL